MTENDNVLRPGEPPIPAPLNPTFNAPVTPEAPAPAAPGYAASAPVASAGGSTYPAPAAAGTYPAPGAYQPHPPGMGAPVGNGTYGVPSNQSKNWLGITSLVLSLLGASVIGIIFGHLALRANKRGEADNKGMSLAGTIIGYVMLVAGALILWVVVFQVKAEVDNGNEMYNAKSDMVNIGYEIAIHYVDYTEAPEVSIVGDEYRIDDATVPVTATNPDLDFQATNGMDWCATLTYGDASDRDFVTYSAENNLSEAPCPPLDSA